MELVKALGPRGVCHSRGKRIIQGQAYGSRGNPTVRVLFVSPYDAIRGPMAETFALAYGAEEIDFFSAGLVPGGLVRPQTLTVMKEAGMEVSWEHPRYLLPEHLIGVDYLVTISCDVDQLRLKFFQGKAIKWEVEDPLNKGLDVDFYREARDNIEGLVRELVLAFRDGTVDELVGRSEEKVEAS